MFQGGEGRFIFVPREEKVGLYMFLGGEGRFIFVPGRRK